MGENREYVTHPDEKGSINISEEVMAAIAASAVSEVPGVAGFSTSLGKDIAELLGKKTVSKGVKVAVENEQIKIDVYLTAKLGYAVNEMGAEVQKAVISAVESMTGFSVNAVNVHICGVALEKDK